MKINDFLQHENGVEFLASQGSLWILPQSDKIIRVVYNPGGGLKDTPSLMLEKQPSFTKWKCIDQLDTVVIETDFVSVRVLKSTGAIAYYDRKGTLLTKEPTTGGKSVEEIDVIKTIFDTDEAIEFKNTADGLRVKTNASKTVVDRKAWHAKLEFEWAENEALYGLGSHEEGIMNLRGTQQYLYQQNMKAVVPSFVSTRGYGILIDNYSLMTFHDDMHGSYIWIDVADQVDYYFMYGPGFDQIVCNYRNLTGDTPMLPKWAYGYVQSKERYKTADELVDVAKEYRERNIPLDCIVLDWQSWPGELWGEKSFDLGRFKDPVNMMERLHDVNVKLMISIWPNMAPGGENHKEMLEKGYLLGNRSTYNAFDEDARKMYWNDANDGLFSKGVDAWWCDCTEPFEADWNGILKAEPEKRLEINCNEAKTYLDPGYINAYSLLHSKGIYEGQRAIEKEKRVVNLTRSSYAGQHKYATITWSGDTYASWKTLGQQIPAGLNFCATGEPYWTMDIGAFFTSEKEQWFWSGEYNDGHEDLGYRELYVRWLQYGTFVPMFRSHGTDTPREVWRFGEPGEVFYDSIVKFIDLRYKIMPYIYSLAGATTFEAYTMMRALGLDFPEDTKTHNIADQYMFGPAFMVCPVTEPFYYEHESVVLNKTPMVSVYLPSGSDWYDFWSKEKYTGGQSIQVEAPLETMPLFVKEGSIVPMGIKKVQHTLEDDYKEIDICIYEGQDGSFVLYEDAGDGYEYEAGKYSMIDFIWNQENKSLEIGKRKGSFKGMVEERIINVKLVGGEMKQVQYVGDAKLVLF